MTAFSTIEEGLLDAQVKAERLFSETEKRGLIQSGISEKKNRIE